MLDMLVRRSLPPSALVLCVQRLAAWHVGSGKVGSVATSGEKRLLTVPRTHKNLDLFCNFSGGMEPVFNSSLV